MTRRTCRSILSRFELDQKNKKCVSENNLAADQISRVAIDKNLRFSARTASSCVPLMRFEDFVIVVHTLSCVHYAFHSCLCFRIICFVTSEFMRDKNIVKLFNADSLMRWLFHKMLFLTVKCCYLKLPDNYRFAYDGCRDRKLFMYIFVKPNFSNQLISANSLSAKQEATRFLHIYIYVRVLEYSRF